MPQSTQNTAPSKRRRIAAIAGSALVVSALAVGAAGCVPRTHIDISSDGIQVSDEATGESYTVPMPTVGRGGTTAERSITVTGTDSVQVAPDMAEISLGVNAQAEDAATAQSDAAETAEAVTAALVEKLGVSEDDISTENLYLNPQYDYSSSPEQIVGYTMNVTLRVKGLTIEEAGEAISYAVAAGADEVNSVSYYCSDYDAQYRQALDAALAMAREKAASIAASNGDTLGAQLSVTEGYDGQYYRGENSKSYAGSAFAADEAAVDAAAGTTLNVDPGTIEIEASVTVEYEVLAG